MQGRKGLQVAEIHSVEGGGERPGSSGYAHGSGHGGGYGGGQGGGQGATEVIEGTVKFVTTDKDFGVVIPDERGKDLFVSGRHLDSYVLSVVPQDQRDAPHLSTGTPR